MFSTNNFNLKKHILILAGGTGGHISPGIALARAFEKEGKKAVILSLERNRNHPDFQKTDLDIRFYNAPRFSRKPADLLLFPFRFLKSAWFALDLLREIKPVAVVGMGGYTTFPALIAAYFFKTPYYLCEQNAVPGKATRWFAGGARKIFLTFPLDRKRYRAISQKGEILGNPARREIIKAALNKKKGRKSTSENIRENPFPELEKKVGGDRAFRILVLGGSQGSVQLNRMTLDAAPKLPQTVWALQCGEANLSHVSSEIGEAQVGDRIFPFGYHTSIFDLYGEADILVCRSGAGVISEASLFGLPMILVPYPYAADNHQLENARAFQREGAAIVIDTKETSGEPLVEAIDKLISDHDLFAQMSGAAVDQSKPEAAAEIAGRIISDSKLALKEE